VRSTGTHEFTVIAGELKGRRLVVPDIGVTRPPLTRLRRSIFDFLMPYLEGARFLDLFSGTGSYLFEAVSRGVERAVGIEIEKRLADAINRNAIRLRVRDRLECRCGDVFAAIPACHAKGERFDLIMLAPPQYKELVGQTMRALRDYPVASSKGLIICQHDTKETGEIDSTGFALVQQRVYGNTTFSVYREYGH
jgi:16S rRNA (guanine966-N2)-methyltransferase